MLSANLPILRTSMNYNVASPMMGATPGVWRGENGLQQYSMTFESMDTVSVALWNIFTDRLKFGKGTPQLDMLQDLKFIPIMVIDYHEFQIYCSEPDPIH